MNGKKEQSALYKAYSLNTWGTIELNVPEGMTKKDAETVYWPRSARHFANELMYWSASLNKQYILIELPQRQVYTGTPTLQ